MDEGKARPATAPDLAVVDLLSTERLRTLALCRALRDDLGSMADAMTSSNADDEHDPEGATLAFERAQTAALLSQSQSRVAEIDQALQRHERGSYGICKKCGEAIPAERLAARPAAQTCLRCAL
jgi:RNA polymerase-binding transcription factor DksA